MQTTIANAETLVSRRLDVSVRRMGGGEAMQCRTYEVGLNGLFLDSAASLSKGQEVEVTFAAASDEPLSLSCRVEATLGTNAFLQFGTLTSHQRQRLEQVIWPPWDGSDLLDGLILMSDRYGATSLPEWLRLTGLLSVWQPRVASRQHRH
jgi:hypothetical protein